MAATAHIIFDSTPHTDFPVLSFSTKATEVPHACDRGKEFGVILAANAAAIAGRQDHLGPPGAGGMIYGDFTRKATDGFEFLVLCVKPSLVG